MTRPLFLVPHLLVVAALALPAGCGRSTDDRPVYNEVLGDGPIGAPTVARAIDVGILRDQTAYQPARRPDAAPAAGAFGGGPEAEAVLDVARGAMQSLKDLDAGALLDAFVPQQVAALTANLSEIEDAIDSLIRMHAAYLDKTKEQRAAMGDAAAAIDAVPQKLIDVFSSALRADVLDDENAVLTVDAAALEQGLSDLFTEIGPALAAMGGGMTPGAMPGVPPVSPPPDSNAPAPPPSPPGMPGAMPGMPPGGLTPEMLQEMTNLDLGEADLPTITLRKVDGNWKLDLQRTVTGEQAELVVEAAELLGSFADQLFAKIESVETLDDQTYMNMVMQTAMPMAGQFMMLMSRAQEVFGLPDPGDLDDVEDVAAPEEPQTEPARTDPNRP